MIVEFKRDLETLESLQMYRKYILEGSAFILNSDLSYQLREEVCEQFKIEFTDVFIVGSGKLGFSIKPSRRFEEFNDDSDIDLAIVSKTLFEQIWKDAYLYYKSSADWPKHKHFFKYLAQGWIRPDKLPPSEFFQFSQDWWDFFTKVTNSHRYGPYKIRAGLYHSHFFLEEYQKICIEQCIQELN